MASKDKNRNLVAAICYIPIITIVISIVVYFVEQEDKYVRFHALQAFLFSVFYYFLIFVLGNLPFVGNFVSVIFFLAALIFWLFAMIKSFNGHLFKLPVIGVIAEKKVK